MRKPVIIIAALSMLMVLRTSYAFAQNDRVLRYIDAQQVEKRKAGENSYEYRVKEHLDSNTALRLDIGDRPIEDLEVRLRQEGSSPDTYVKASFYPDRYGFDNDKRERVDNTDLYTLNWNVENREARGRPLTLAAYNGDIYVDSVIVHYVDERAAAGAYRGYERGRLAEESERDDLSREAARRCERMRSAPPAFNLDSRDQVGDLISGLISGATTVSGELEGQCISEAGYYANGRLQQRIEFPLDDRRGQRRFSVEVTPGVDAELRAYTVDGQREVVKLGRPRR